MKEELRKEIEETIEKSPLEFDPGHAKKTLEWVLKLKPEADEALQIAALAHDIERGVTGITETYGLKDLSDIEEVREFKRQHAKRSALIISDLMEKYGYNSEMIKRVNFLVEKHDEGGDDKDLNILMDSDSIAYFDYHVEMYYKKNGRSKTKDKISFMFKRMSDKAKEIVKNIKYDNSEIIEITQEVFSED
jgi:hypothetical protein